MFPLFLGSHWSAGVDGATVTTRLGWITSGASAIIVLLAPIFGTIADAGGYRKRFLLILGATGALATAALGTIGEGSWALAAAVYTVAFIGYYGSTIFYDSLIVDVCPPRYYSFVSSLGSRLDTLVGPYCWRCTFTCWYRHRHSGLRTPHRLPGSPFISVGIWWALFMAPLFLFVPENPSSRQVHKHVVRAAYRELKDTISHIREYRNVVIFLIAYWLYIGGVCSPSLQWRSISGSVSVSRSKTWCWRC